MSSKSTDIKNKGGVKSKVGLKGKSTLKSKTGTPKGNENNITVRKSKTKKATPKSDGHEDHLPTSEELELSNAATAEAEELTRKMRELVDGGGGRMTLKASISTREMWDEQEKEKNTKISNTKDIKTISQKKPDLPLVEEIVEVSEMEIINEDKIEDIVEEKVEKVEEKIEDEVEDIVKEKVEDNNEDKVEDKVEDNNEDKVEDKVEENNEDKVEDKVEENNDSVESGVVVESGGVVEREGGGQVNDIKTSNESELLTDPPPSPSSSQGKEEKDKLVYKNNPAASPKRNTENVLEIESTNVGYEEKMKKPELIKQESTIWTSQHKAKHLGKNFNEIMGIVPVTPRKSDLLILTFLIGIPVFLFVLGFSAFGYGINVFKFLSNNPNYGSAGFVMAFFIGACMYMLDGEYWDGEYDRHFWSCECLQKVKPLNKFRKVILTVASVFFVSGVIFRVESYPYGPICIFLLFLVIYLTGVKRIVMGKAYDTRQYVGTLPLPLIFTAAWVFVWWVIWTNQVPGGNQYKIWSPSVSSRYVAWSAETKLHYAERIGCPEDDDIDDKTDDVYSNCLSPFMLWCTPAAVSFALVIFALTTYVLDPNDTHGAPKMVGQFILVLLFGMWCSASLSGAGSVLTTAILAFVFAGLIAVCGFVVYTCGLEMFHEPDKQPFVQKMKAKYGSMADVLRGLLIVTCAPLIMGFFALSFVNQCIRKLPCIPITKVLDDSDRHLYLTKIGSAMYTSMLSWKWTNVYVYALYWGIFFFTCNVVISQFTILFLSWLIVFISEYSLAVVSGIFFVVGFIMFMLPPVPGVPVYLSSGIILIAAGEERFGLEGSIIYAFIFCMALKLMAVVGQMYLFGVPLGKYVSVRRTVGVNSSLVRTMKVVLSKPGFSIAKVTVLTGGPDWPTSVLCGILNLNVFQILLGTLPVALLIFPTILAGSYFYLSDRDPKFQTLATIFAATAALVQSGSMLVAAYYLDKAAIVYKDEIDAMPFDEEVRVAEEKAEILKKRYSAATDWSVQPCISKFLLVMSTILMVMCCYIVQLIPCFEPYELTSRIRTLPGGNWYNLIIWPQGFLAIALFLSSFLLFYIYNKISTCRANSWPMPEQTALEPKA